MKPTQDDTNYYLSYCLFQTYADKTTGLKLVFNNRLSNCIIHIDTETIETVQVEEGASITSHMVYEAAMCKTALTPGGGPYRP